MPSDRCSNEGQSIEYCNGRVVFIDIVEVTHIHNILSTATHKFISHTSVGTLLEDGNVNRKHVGNSIKN
jgi:hypothetical protein